MPKKVLICEDEAIVRIWLRRELERQGYDVVGEARDGNAAVEMAVALDPDLIFMDIKMPRQDGLAASKAILYRRAVPIVLLTAYGERDTVERALQAGVSGYLVKPVESAQIAPAIALASARFSELMKLRSQVETLEDALEVRKLVDRAKGLLMRHFGLDEPGAHQLLQRISSRERVSVKEAAVRVIKSADAGTLSREPRADRTGGD